MKQKHLQEVGQLLLDKHVENPEVTRRAVSGWILFLSKLLLVTNLVSDGALFPRFKQKSKYNFKRI